MKTLKRIMILVGCLFGSLQEGLSQRYPVQVITTITPPYSLYLSDYSSAESNSLQTLITLQDLEKTNLRVKLRVTLEGAGITLRTNPSYVPPAIILQGGVPELLTGFDLRNYLNPDHLDFSGISKAAFIQSGRLPEGFYTLTIEVLDYTLGLQISNRSPANAWIVLNDPPLINIPFNGDKLTATDPQNIMFSWTPRHTASPNAAFTTEYEFKLVEMYPGQTNPDVAIRSSNSIYKTTTTLTSLNYSIIEPTLVPGKKYAFRIRAYDTNGRDLFKNNGYSETYVFQYGDACILPAEIEAEGLDPNRVRIQWEPSSVHSGFTLQYRKEGQSDWYTKDTYSSSQIIPELNGGTTYEYRVQSRCGTIRGEESPVYTVTTPAEDEEEKGYVCGTAIPDLNLSPNPLEKPLRPFDRVSIGDAKMIVKEATSNGDGSYKGKGYMPMPYFNAAVLSVTFQQLVVNENYEAIGGDVRTVWSENSRFYKDMTKKTEQLDETGEDPEDETGTDTNEETGDQVIASEVTIDGEVTDIISNEDGTVTVVKADGSQEVITPDEDGDMLVTDSSGDQWVVGSDGGVSQGGVSGGGAPDSSVGDLASGNSLEEGEVNFGPVKAFFSAIPESISTDADGYCTYENIGAEIQLSVKDATVAETSFTIPDVTISFKQHCQNKDFKDVNIKYENEEGFDIGKVGFIDGLVKSANLAVDNEGNLSGGLLFKATLNEDQVIEEVFVIKKGITGDFSFAFSGGQNFDGSFDLNNVHGINLELRKASKLLAKLENGVFNDQSEFVGTFKIASGVVAYETSYFKSELKALAIEATYSFKEGVKLTSGSARVQFSQMKGLTGNVVLDLSYLDNNVSSTISAGSLKGFGMEFSALNLSAKMTSTFDLEELTGTFKAKHPEFNTALDVTGFLFNEEGLQSFETSGNIKHGAYEFIVQECSYNKDDEKITIDALAKVTTDGVEAVVTVTGFTIDFEGNISYDEISGEVKSDVVLGPLLVRFEGKVRDSNGGSYDDKPTKEFSGKGTVMLKTITKNGKENYKEVDKVDFTYRKYKKEDDGGLISASLSWKGEVSFGDIQGIGVSLEEFALSVDEEEKLTGNLKFGALLEEDKSIRDIFLIKKGLGGSLTYNFSGEKNFVGNFDFSGLTNINLIAKKGETELAKLKNGTFSGTVLNGTFEALPNAKYTSNSFSLDLNELQLSGSYDFAENELIINSGKGKVTASGIQGLDGNIVLGIEYGVDGNFNASVASETSLSGLGFTFSDLSLNVNFTKDFDLQEISGGLKASHDQISTKVNITTFKVKNGKLETLDASGGIVYKGFDFNLSKCTYANNVLTLTAKLAINATGTEAQFGVKDFEISSDGEISIKEVNGNLNKGNHLNIGFKIKMKETRFTGTFTGKLKTIGVGVAGKLDIGKQDDFNFAYLELEANTNIVLGATGLKITTLGGQIGYNYKLTYNQSKNEFTGDPEQGNYVLGLKLGMGDVANMCEIVGNPIVQFSSSSLNISLDGILNITKNNPMISSNLRADYALPANTLSASINTKFDVPKNSGAIFSANCDIGFGIADNQWYAEGNNISASLLNVITYSGSFNYRGQVNPFLVNAISLSGRAYMGFEFEYSKDFGAGTNVNIKANASFNSYVEAQLNENGLLAEMAVDVTGNLGMDINVIGYNLASINATVTADAKVGFNNGKGYVTGSADASLSVAHFDYEAVPVEFDYKFDVL